MNSNYIFLLSVGILLLQDIKPTNAEITSSNWTVVSGNGEVQTTGSTIQLEINFMEEQNNIMELFLYYNNKSVYNITVYAAGFKQTILEPVGTDKRFNVTVTEKTSATLSNITVTFLVTIENLKEKDTNSTLEINDINFTVDSPVYDNFLVQGCPAPAPNSGVTSSKGTGCSADEYNSYNCNTTFDCADGYKGDSVTRTCLNNATWSGEEISCQKIDDGLSGGAIAGIVIGVVVITGIIVAGALHFTGHMKIPYLDAKD